MPYEIFLARRYLRSRRKHRLARATTLIAVFGIAAGVASLIVALALAEGFRDELRGIDQSSAQVTRDVSATIEQGALEPVFGAGREEQTLPAVVLGAELAAR